MLLQKIRACRARSRLLLLCREAERTKARQKKAFIANAHVTFQRAIRNKQMHRNNGQ